MCCFLTALFAAVRYNLAGQRKHAVRTYSIVQEVYEGKGWAFISDHCNFTLGR